MGRSCTVCTHDDRAAIDQAIVAGKDDAVIAREFVLRRHAVGRHRAAHISSSLIAVHKRSQERDAISLRDRVEELYDEAKEVLQGAKEDKQRGLSLAALKRMESILSLIGRLTGELDERPTVQVLNVTASPEWLAVRTAMLQALAPYPDAAAAVADALHELESRRAIAG